MNIRLFGQKIAIDIASGSNDAKWSQACTENRDNADNVHTVHFPNGKVNWDYKDNDNNRSCVRPVVALELVTSFPILFTSVARIK
jgi:hypothetical protein